MTKNCLSCNSPIEQTKGKRAKLYCGALCKANYFKIKAFSDVVHISRTEYERLLAIESKFEGIKDIPDSLYPDGNNAKIASLMEKQRNTNKKMLSKANGVVNASEVRFNTVNVLPDRLPGESTIDFKIRMAQS